MKIYVSELNQVYLEGELLKGTDLTRIIGAGDFKDNMLSPQTEGLPFLPVLPNYIQKVSARAVEVALLKFPGLASTYVTSVDVYSEESVIVYFSGNGRDDYDVEVMYSELSMTNDQILKAVVDNEARLLAEKKERERQRNLAEAKKKETAAKLRRVKEHEIYIRISEQIKAGTYHQPIIRVDD